MYFKKEMKMKNMMRVDLEMKFLSSVHLELYKNFLQLHYSRYIFNSISLFISFHLQAFDSHVDSNTQQQRFTPSIVPPSLPSSSLGTTPGITQHTSNNIPPSTSLGATPGVMQHNISPSTSLGTAPHDTSHNVVPSSTLGTTPFTLGTIQHTQRNLTTSLPISSSQTTPGTTPLSAQQQYLATLVYKLCDVLVHI